jgi:uncharacterized protein (TIGR00369 family)
MAAVSATHPTTDAEAPIWRQPAIGGFADARGLGLSGMDRIRLGREGRMPFSPMGYLTEISFTAASRGHTSFTLPASPWFTNSAGVIPGGILAVLGDAPLGASIHTEVPPGVAFTTAEISMTMLRPVRPDPDGKISGTGQVIHRGRSMALSEAFLINESTGDLVAHATSRCSIFPPVDPVPDPPEDPPVLDQPLPGASPDHPLRRPLQGGALPQETWERMSGLEVLRAQVARELQPAPPIFHLLGIRPTAAEQGSVEMVLPCSPWLAQSMGNVQGGFLALLADNALTASVFTTAEAGTAVAPLDLKVNMLRPVAPDMRDLTAKAEVVHRGRTLAIASCRIENADGKPVALATGSSMYLPGRPASLIGVEQLGSDSSDPEDEPGA